MFLEVSFLLAYKIKNRVSYKFVKKIPIKKFHITPHPYLPYIYKKGAYPADCKVSKENLDKMRFEFEYWYPMDLRVSGKDLIRNHLTMFFSLLLD